MSDKFTFWLSFIEVARNAIKQILDDGTEYNVSFANVYKKQNNIVFDLINKEIIGCYTTEWFKFPNNQIVGKQKIMLYNKGHFTLSVYMPTIFRDMGTFEERHITNFHNEENKIINEGLIIDVSIRFGFGVIYLDDSMFK